VTGHLWRERFEDIRTFERHLDRSATVVLKFFLHVSRETQRERLLERLDEPAKHWKFDLDDLLERKAWSRYRTAYTDALAATSRAHAPWYVIPADHKWFAHLLIAEIIVDTLEGVDLSLPKASAERGRALDRARRILTAGRRRSSRA
jgi:polyphosphate kinase 2 (PPK2 family)